MKALKIFLLNFSLFAMQSCYTTSGWNTIGGSYFHNYSKDTLYYQKAMERFGTAHEELMVDTSFLREYHHFRNPEDKNEALSGKKLYPLYPEIIWPGFKVWHIKSPDSDYVYQLGLFTCNANNTRYNECQISIHHVSEIKNRELFNYNNLDPNSKEYKERFDSDSKEYKARNEHLIKKFETDLFPLIEPYFNKN